MRGKSYWSTKEQLLLFGRCVLPKFSTDCFRNISSNCCLRIKHRIRQGNHRISIQKAAFVCSWFCLPGCMVKWDLCKPVWCLASKKKQVIMTYIKNWTSWVITVGYHDKTSKWLTISLCLSVIGGWHPEKLFFVLLTWCLLIDISFLSPTAIQAMIWIDKNQFRSSCYFRKLWFFST